MNREQRIPDGGMYQEWMSLIDLLERDKAEELEILTTNKRWRELQSYEAESMGYNEHSEWSVKETDVLILIDDIYLVYLNKDDYQLSVR